MKYNNMVTFLFAQNKYKCSVACFCHLQFMHQVIS